MSDGLPVIIVDDDPAVCEITSETVKRFYTWGEVIPFADSYEALSFCRKQKTGVAIFVLDIFMGNKSGFDFLDSIMDKFPMASQDTIIIICEICKITYAGSALREKYCKVLRLCLVYVLKKERFPSVVVIGERWSAA